MRTGHKVGIAIGTACLCAAFAAFLVALFRAMSNVPVPDPETVKSLATGLERINAGIGFLLWCRLALLELLLKAPFPFLWPSLFRGT
jgi:hypothetical protein